MKESGAMDKLFTDRKSAGRALAQRLQALELVDPVVLALPRGGVPIGVEVARALGAPLDLLLVRKIGTPQQPELAAAALVDGEPPELVLNSYVIGLANVPRAHVEAEAQREHAELLRRRAAYLGDRAPEPVAGRTVLLVDDGIATGTCVRAALQALHKRRPARLILAVPVAPQETLAQLGPLVDELVVLATPEPFFAIGSHYVDFHQLQDDEVTAGLAEVAHFRGTHAPAPYP
jgi:putative phosphoribosyl transferase